MASSRRTATNEDVATYGTGKTYTEGNFSVWEQLTDVNQVTATASDVLEVYEDGVTITNLYEDTDAINGAVCDADYFRIIRAAAGEGTSSTGIPVDDGTMAGFRVTSGGATVLQINEPYSQLQDLCGKATADTAGYVFSVRQNGGKMIGCIAFDVTNVEISTAAGFRVGPGCIAVNCLAHNVQSTGVAWGFTTNEGTGIAYFYNNTENDCGTWGLDVDTGETAISKNNVWDDGIDEDGTYTDTTDTTDTPTYEAGVDDFHLASNDVTAKDQGTDLSGAAPENEAVFPFDDDIDGETRSGTWDIGFDEIVAVGAIAPTGALYGPLVGPLGGPI